MNKITKEEKVKIFDDLIKYYRFCKSDRRNHIFNAIYAAKKYRKSGASKQELDEVEKSFQKAKNSYSYYSSITTSSKTNRYSKSYSSTCANGCKCW